MKALFRCCKPRKESECPENDGAPPHLPSSTGAPKRYYMRFSHNTRVYSVQIDPQLVEGLRSAYATFPSYYHDFSASCIDDITDDDITKFTNREPVSEHIRTTLRKPFVSDYAYLRCGLHSVEGTFIVPSDPSCMAGYVCACIMTYIQRMHQSDYAWDILMFDFQHAVKPYMY